MENFEVVQRCMVCSGRFHPRPLLRLENMPNAAQFFPDATALATERGYDLDIFQCASCGLIQLAVPPVPYYREVVRAAAYSAEMRLFRQEQFSRFSRRFNLAGRKVLEVGCGGGEYLELLAGAGMQAYGLEASPQAVAQCRKQGLNAFVGYIDTEEDVVAEAPYAAFFILNFLEHFPNPRSALRGMANALEPGGVCLIEVPNFTMMVREELSSEFIRDHLAYFTRESLTHVLATSGFEVIDCQEVWHDYILSATARKREPADLSGFVQRQQHLQREIGRFLDQFGPRRVAVWGAGHQALTVLSLASMQDRIRYVVDSAPFKQGKFTPATHLPIYHPDMLREDPVDGIIVMAASYSDEVVGIIHRQYDSGMRVAILRGGDLEIIAKPV